MLILNKHLPRQLFFAGETPSGDQQAKELNSVGKVDTGTPDTNRPDDLSKGYNRADLYQKAQQAIKDLRFHGKEKEALDLENSLKVAQEKEGLTIENSETVKAGYAQRVKSLLNNALQLIVGAKGLGDPRPNGTKETIIGSSPASRPESTGLPPGYVRFSNGSVGYVGGYKKPTAGKAPDVDGPKPMLPAT